jgi:type IV pilus assembly protein PilM
MVDWKKDIKLGKRAGGEEVADAATPAEKVPFWKKEIGGSRKAKPTVEPADAMLPEPVAFDAVAEPEVADEEFPWDAGEPADPPAAENEPDPTPAPVAEAPEPEPVVEPLPELEADDGGYGWLTAGIEQGTTELRSWAEATLAELEAELGAEAAPIVDDEPVEPTQELTAVADGAPVEVPETAPAAFAPPAPAPGIHAPVRASELPPLPGEEPAAKQPFWRRDLSAKKKRDDAEPTAARKPRREKAAKPKREVAPKPTGDAESVPFWRRELGGKKTKHEPKAAPAATPVATAGDADEKLPFWKRDLGGKKQRGPKAPRAATPPKAAKPARAKAAKQPRGKRDKPPAARASQRHKQLVGLKIGGSQLAAATVKNNGHALVTQLAREPLEAGIVVGGELRDPEALAAALKDFFGRHKLPKRNVRLGIANNRIGVRTLDIVGIEDPKQLANAIRFRAQEALPIPIEDAVLDYQVLSEETNAAGESVRRVLLVVAYRELVDRYVDACRRAGVRLAGIDLEAFALLRALAEPRADGAAGGSALVAVSIGHDRTTFAVSDGRTCEFTRVLEWGGFSLNVAIARALDVAPSEAEPLKRELSVNGAEVPDGLSPEQAEAARDAMRKQVHAFARELVSSLQFYQGQPGSLPIGSITITGGTAHLEGLADEIHRLIGVPVEVGDPLVRVEVGKKVRDDGQLGSLAIAIGLGIED